MAAETDGRTRRKTVVRFPLRPHLNVAFIDLPADLQVHEAERLARLLRTLVQPDDASQRQQSDED